MSSIRVPSVDLLRALRLTARNALASSTISSSSSNASLWHATTCHARRQCRPNATRFFVTSTPFKLADRSQQSQAQAQSQTQSRPRSHQQTNASSSSSLPSIQSTSKQQKQAKNPFAPVNHDRGPASKEDTQTDFGIMDIYANIPNPATSIDACTSDGFHLDNGIKITGYAGLLVAGGEAWSWRPWLALQSGSSSTSTSTSTSSSPPTSGPEISLLLDARRGILTIPKQSLGLFTLLHPKPDLLIIGTGSRLWMLAPETKKYLAEELGVRVDVMDTGNASAAYNLLAKERGVEGGAGVGGAFLPIGWKGPEVGKVGKTVKRSVRR